MTIPRGAESLRLVSFRGCLESGAASGKLSRPDFARLSRLLDRAIAERATIEEFHGAAARLGLLVPRWLPWRRAS